MIDKQSDWEVKSNKSTQSLLLWTTLWVVSVFFLSIGTKYFWHFQTLPTVFVFIVNLAVGVAWIKAIHRFVRSQDEMQQTMFLEATALTLGMTFVFGGSYQLWKHISFISHEPSVSLMMCFIGLSLTISVFLIGLKYK